MGDAEVDLLDTLIIVSCVLSLLGGLALMLTCLAPANRRKHARELLFWLSFSDTVTSVTYIVSVMYPSDNVFCKTTALVSIFFPVASFLWTDIIALYLYAIVVSREFRSEKEWRRIMRTYHWFAWGTSFLIILLVAATDHEGRPDGDAEDEESNSSTLGVPSARLQWCWVRGSTPEEQFVWELVGGKLVEWGSCVFITVVYVFIIRRLWRMNFSRHRSSGGSSHSSGLGADELAAGTRPLLAEDQGRLSGVLSEDESEAEEVGEDGSRAGVASCVDTVSLQSGRSLATGGATDSDAEESLGSSNQDLVVSEVSVGRSTACSPSLTQQNTDRNAGTGNGGRSSWRLSHLLSAAAIGSGFDSGSGADSTAHTTSTSHARSSDGGNSYFNKFFVQMSIVPCLFFFARFWGSLRVVLQYAAPEALRQAAFVGFMQAVMDPSQGFCNFLLFVATSEEERRGFWRNMGAGAAYLGSSLNRLGEEHVPHFARARQALCRCCCFCEEDWDRRCRVRRDGRRGDLGAGSAAEKDQSYVSVHIGENEDEDDLSRV